MGNLNDNKEIFQNNVASLIKDNKNKHFLLESPTGTGKTLAVIKGIEQLSIHKNHSKKKWLILVPEILQIKNLKEEFIKHKKDYIYNEFVEDIICYASFPKYENRNDLNLWFNEVHKLSDVKWEVAKTIDFDHIISDSATINDDIHSKLSLISPLYRYKITIQQAVEMGLSPSPTLHIHTVHLSTTEDYVVVNKDGSKFTTSEMNYYDNLCAEITRSKLLFNTMGRAWDEIRMKNLGSKRKQFMAHVKTEYIKNNIISDLKKRNVKYICFCGSVKQAKELGGKNAISAKDGKKNNISVIDDFNNGKTKCIYSVGMAVEGMNLNGIEEGVIVQLSAEDRLDIQKTGRIMRNDNPVIHIPILKGTRDEQFLKNFLFKSGIKKESVKYV